MPRACCPCFVGSMAFHIVIGRVTRCNRGHMTWCHVTWFGFMNAWPHPMPGLFDSQTALPKADGREAFLITHAYGYAIILRDGSADCHHWTNKTIQPPVPAILEGELMQNGVFLAYDCLLTPAVGYAWHGRHITRHAAAQAVVHRLSILGLKSGFFCRSTQKPVADASTSLFSVWVCTHSARCSSACNGPMTWAFLVMASFSPTTRWRAMAPPVVSGR